MDQFEDKDDTQLGMLGGRLQRLFEEQVAKKADIEKRWLEDLRQYNGIYDPEVAAALENSNRSKAFINVTRPKCNKQEARIGDVLFPTDDRNWGIDPTPVPELIDKVGDKTPITADGKALTVNGQPVTESKVAAELMAQARKASEGMQREMDDQLTECNYNGVGRDVIHNAVVLGTGILKGPVIVGRTKKSWQKVTDEMGNSVQVIQEIDEHRPIAESVDPWNFYPDMSATKTADAEFFFERHYMTRRQLRDLKKRPGFITKQITALMGSDEKGRSTNSFLPQLREISGAAFSYQAYENRYEVIEYHGPIARADLEACGCNMSEDGEGDEEYEGIVWFCDGYILKAVVNPLDTEEAPYSVFCWEKDDTSIFGFGVPRLSRHQQNVMNGAWRMAMDHGGLSVGPQMVINERVIRPADGKWEITPRKVWLLNDPMVPINQAFGSFEINSHINELMVIINQAKAMLDEESGTTPEQGDTGLAPRTNLGVAMTMNSHNIDVRRAAKNWDDDITKPFLGRLYDWNMQYNDNEEIKGDYRVVARGSSTLLAKEMQQAQLMQFAQLSMNPVLGPTTKFLPLQRKIAQALQLEADEVVKTDEEMQADAEKQAQQGPQMPPEIQLQMQKLQLEGQKFQATMQLEVKRLEADTMKIQMQAKNDAMDAETARAQIQRDFAQFQFEIQRQERAEQLEMAKMANERQMTIEALRANLGMKKLELDSKHQLFNAEAAIKAQQGSGL